MKPKNKLGGKLDKIKKAVSYEASKRVTQIEREEAAVEAETNEERDELIESLQKQLKDLKQDYAILSLEFKEYKSNTTAQTSKIRANLNKIEEYFYLCLDTLKFYANGEHVEPGTFKDRIVDKGERAVELLNKIENQK